MYVCLCKGITDQDIKEAVYNGLDTIKDLKNKFAVGSQCGGCISVVKQVLNKELADNARYYQVA